MTYEEIKPLMKVLKIHLDTRDKRFMFLKILFPEFTSTINLEGSSSTAAFNIFNEFKKQQMLGSLIACLNNHFDTNLTIPTT